MKTSTEGIALIKHFEGFKSRAYYCPAGKETIGYGHVIKPKEHFGTLTEAQAYDLLLQDLVERERDVLFLVKVPLTQGQFDALVSFVYNLGSDIDSDLKPEGLGDSTLLKKLNAGDYDGAVSEFKKWNNSKGKVETGLVKRRAAEMALFTGKDWRAAA